MKEAFPYIFDIRRFALNDGPGIRTTVFMKGCPLSCIWCHNPESISIKQEIAFNPGLCISCGTCQTVCPEAAVSINPSVRINRRKCTVCGNCAAHCPSTAIRTVGKKYAIDELTEIILRDRHFFAASGGGVTFSGGEPTLWMEYLNAVLRALKKERIHTAIQTCGLFDYNCFSRLILPFTDLIMFDIKLMDAEKHKRYTGRENPTILENFRLLTKDAGSRIIPRVPLAPEITATKSNLPDIAFFLAGLGYKSCELLSYNPMVTEKRQALGLKISPYLSKLPIGSEEENNLRKLFLERLLKQIDTAA